MRPRAFLLQSQRISKSFRTLLREPNIRHTFPKAAPLLLRKELWFPHPPVTSLSQVVVGGPEDQIHPLLAPPLAEEGVVEGILEKMLHMMVRLPPLPEVEGEERLQRPLPKEPLGPTTVAAMRQVGEEGLHRPLPKEPLTPTTVAAMRQVGEEGVQLPLPKEPLGPTTRAEM